MEVGQEPDPAPAAVFHPVAAEVELDHDDSVGDEHLPRERLLVLKGRVEGGEDGVAARHHQATRCRTGQSD